MLNDYKIIQVYFTVKDLIKLTGLSGYKIRKIIKIKKVPYNQHSYTNTIRIIRIHRNEVIKYFNIKI